MRLENIRERERDWDSINPLFGPFHARLGLVLGGRTLEGRHGKAGKSRPATICTTVSQHKIIFVCIAPQAEGLNVWLSVKIDFYVMVGGDGKIIWSQAINNLFMEWLFVPFLKKYGRTNIEPVKN